MRLDRQRRSTVIPVDDFELVLKEISEVEALWRVNAEQIPYAGEQIPYAATNTSTVGFKAGEANAGKT